MGVEGVWPSSPERFIVLEVSRVHAARGVKRGEACRKGTYVFSCCQLF